MRTVTAADRQAATARRHIPLIEADLRRQLAACGLTHAGCCAYPPHRQAVDRLLDSLANARLLASLGGHP